MDNVPYIDYQRSKWEAADEQTRADHGGPLGDVFGELSQHQPIQYRGRPAPRIDGTRDLDVRSLLLAAGVTEVEATLALQYSFFLPRSSDPYAQGIQVWVQAIQCTLRRLGYPLKVDGGLGQHTAAALQDAIGPRWYDLVWLQLLNAAMSAKRVPKPKRRILLGDIETGERRRKLITAAAVLGGGWLLLRGGS